MVAGHGKGWRTLSGARRNPAFGRMISDFVRLRGPQVLGPRDVEHLRSHLVEAFETGSRLPSRGRGIDWRRLADEAGVDGDALLAGKDLLRPGLEALRRELRKPHARIQRDPPLSAMPPPAGSIARAGRRGRRPSSPPAVLTSIADEPRSAELDSFHVEFDSQLRKHGETPTRLSRALKALDLPVEPSTLRMWRIGAKAPSYCDSLEVLRQLERRWDLPAGHFRARLPAPSRAMKGHRVLDIGEAERSRLAWHLPDDFDRRPVEEREEILEWVRRVVVSGSTEYRRYQSAATKHRFAVRFPAMHGVPAGRQLQRALDEAQGGAFPAPPDLAREMSDLVGFKTATLTALGYRRRGVWSTVTAAQRVEHFSLMFGALAAAPGGPVRGAGLPRAALTFGLLALPRVWDWYLRWREHRRGFYTAWEVDMLSLGLALTAPETGWLAQRPDLAERVAAFPGLIDEADVTALRRDWAGACEHLHRYALARSKEISRVARVHRDPFEPILPVLEAESPVGEYRKIAD